jgi:hypothetical protein
LVWIGSAAELIAQQPPVHYLHHGVMPPGAIGSQQLFRGGATPEYFQPVEFLAPSGASVQVAEAGSFAAPAVSPARFGLLVGPVYRLRVSNIPFHPGLEVYPTIEVIERLYPPRGQETRFPIVVELTQEDLEMALDGKFVTRVIYLEDPDLALPVAQDAGKQAWIDSGPGSDPLAVADQFGKPMAILRLGALLPGVQGAPDMQFLFGCPPFLRILPPQGQGVSAPAIAWRPQE